MLMTLNDLQKLVNSAIEDDENLTLDSPIMFQMVDKETDTVVTLRMVELGVAENQADRLTHVLFMFGVPAMRTSRDDLQPEIATRLFDEH